MAINKEFLRHQDYFDSLRKDNPECSNKDFRNRACWKCRSCKSILEECDRIEEDLCDTYDGVMSEDYPGRDYDDMTSEEQTDMFNEVYSLVMERHKARTKTVDQESNTDQSSLKAIAMKLKSTLKATREMQESRIGLLNAAKERLQDIGKMQEQQEQQRQEAIRQANATRQQQAADANSISFMDIYETIQEGYNEWNQNEANRAIRRRFKE